jgi:hypothetical protein
VGSTLYASTKDGQSKKAQLRRAMQNATNIEGLWIGDGLGIGPIAEKELWCPSRKKYE